jgi:DNA-binding CsgD family transcriptional regulator
MLTPREKDVLQMIGEGYSSKEIAQSFGLSVRTIDTHRSNIMRKLKLRGATDMTRLAAKLRLVSQD